MEKRTYKPWLKCSPKKHCKCLLCDGHYFRPLRIKLKSAHQLDCSSAHTQPTRSWAGQKMGGCGLLSRVDGQVMRCSRRQKKEPSRPMSNCCAISRGRANSGAPKDSAMSGNWSENEGHSVNAASWTSSLKQSFKAARQER